MKPYPGNLIEDCAAVHGNTGKRNAAKGPVTLSERIFGRVTPEVREKAETAAKANNETLSAYVGRVVSNAVNN